MFSENIQAGFSAEPVKTSERNIFGQRSSPSLEVRESWAVENSKTFFFFSMDANYCI